MIQRKLYTIGFVKKSAKVFFSLLKNNNVTLIADIRLNNKGQLAGYTKAEDLEYFLSLFGINYQYWPHFAPTKQIRDTYHKNKSFDEYESAYRKLIESRRSVEKVSAALLSKETVCLLCSEPEPDKCHRRIAAELIAETFAPVEITHI